MATKSRNQTPGSTPPGELSPWALAGLGMQFFAAILFFVYVGSWLDRWLNFSPLFLLGELFLGGGGAFYASYRQLTKSRPSPPDHDSDSLPKP